MIARAIQHVVRADYRRIDELVDRVSIIDYRQMVDTRDCTVASPPCRRRAMNAMIAHQTATHRAIARFRRCSGIALHLPVN